MNTHVPTYIPLPEVKDPQAFLMLAEVIKCLKDFTWTENNIVRFTCHALDMTLAYDFSRGQVTIQNDHSCVAYYPNEGNIEQVW